VIKRKVFDEKEIKSWAKKLVKSCNFLTRHKLNSIALHIVIKSFSLFLLNLGQMSHSNRVV
jgi:hypothetical protein